MEATVQMEVAVHESPLLRVSRHTKKATTGTGIPRMTQLAICANCTDMFHLPQASVLNGLAINFFSLVYGDVF